MYLDLIFSDSKLGLFLHFTILHLETKIFFVSNLGGTLCLFHGLITVTCFLVL